MTNDDYIIVPKIPTDEMVNAVTLGCNDDREICIRDYEAALVAAPAHNLIAVDKGELEALVQACSDLIEALSAAADDIQDYGLWTFETQREAEGAAEVDAVKYRLFAARREAALAPFKGDKA